MVQLTIGQKAPEQFDWIHKLAEFVQAFSWLGWPLTIIILAVMFKKPIEQFIGRVRTAEGSGIKASFGDQVEDLKSKVDLAVKAGNDLPAPTMAYDEALPQLVESGIDPVGTVIKAWAAIDGELRKSIGPSNAPRSVMGIMRELGKSEVLGQADIDAIDALHRIRMELLDHRSEAAIDQDQAENYAQAAERMVMKLRLLRRIQRGRQQ